MKTLFPETVKYELISPNKKLIYFCISRRTHKDIIERFKIKIGDKPNRWKIYATPKGGQRLLIWWTRKKTQGGKVKYLPTGQTYKSVRLAAIALGIHSHTIYNHTAKRGRVSKRKFKFVA